mgnify:FL=1
MTHRRERRGRKENPFRRILEPGTPLDPKALPERIEDRKSVSQSAVLQRF